MPTDRFLERTAASRVSNRAIPKTTSSPKDPGKDERLRCIVEIMASGQWCRSFTVRKLAKAWGVSPALVGDDASEASRIVRWSFRAEKLVEIIQSELNRLERLANKCEQTKDFRGAVVASSKLVEFANAMLSDPRVDGDARERRRVGREELVRLGWVPPKGLPGLPQPPEPAPESQVSTVIDAEGEPCVK